jgi:hypothetical protein
VQGIGAWSAHEPNVLLHVLEYPASRCNRRLAIDTNSSDRLARSTAILGELDHLPLPTSGSLDRNFAIGP